MAMAGGLEYPMKGRYRGKAVIISNTVFAKNTGVEDRQASAGDAIAIKKSLRTLGFRDEDIKMRENLTKDEMVNVFTSYAREDYEDYDCFTCVISTHGFYDTYKVGEHNFFGDVIYGTDQVVYLHFLIELLQPKCCPNLKGKPKIFIIQACRGGCVSDLVVTGVQTPPRPVPSNPISRDMPLDDKPDAGPEKYQPGKPLADNPLMIHQVNPVFQDFLIYYATQPYMLAFNNPNSGAYFLQALCEQIEEQAKHCDRLNFIKLLTRVNNDVAYKFTSRITDKNLRGLSEKKQMPRISSRLSKMLVFPIEHVQP